MNERPIAADGSLWVSPAANLAAVLDQKEKFEPWHSSVRY